MNNDTLSNSIAALAKYNNVDSGAIGSLIANFYRNASSLGLNHKKTMSGVGKLALKLLDLNIIEDTKPIYIYLASFIHSISENCDDYYDLILTINKISLKLNSLKKYSDSEQLNIDLIKFYENNYGHEYINIAIILNNLGNTYNSTARYQEGEMCHRRSLSIREEFYGQEHLDVASSLTSLVRSLAFQKRYSEAVPLCEKASKILENIHGTEHPDVATSLYNLANMLESLWRYSEAEPLHRRALAIREKIYGPEHSEVANSLNNLGSIFRSLCRYSEAEPLHRRALEIREKIYGPGHSEVAISLNNLANVLRSLCRYSEAEQFYKRALEIEENIHGSDHQAVVDSITNLAGMLGSLCRYSEAEPLQRRALEINENTHGSDHINVAYTLDNLAITLRNLCRYSEAEPFYRRSLAIREKVCGPDHPDVATSLNNLANLLGDLGCYLEEEQLHRRALAIRENIYGTEHADVASSLNNLANLLTSLRRYSEAEPLHRRALAIREKIYGSEHPDVALSLDNIAYSLSFNSNAEAEQLLRRSLKIQEKVYGYDHPKVLKTLQKIAVLLQLLNRDVEAQQIYKKALELAVSSYLKDTTDFAGLLLNYSNFIYKHDKHKYTDSAIFLGKLGINITQKLRRDVSKIDYDTLKLFDTKIRHRYETLAEMLLDSNRLLEAEHVLNLLKEEEYFNFVRRDITDKIIFASPITFNQEETPLNTRIEILSNTLSSLYLRKEYLKKNKEKTLSEENEIVEITEQIKDASRDFDVFLDNLHAEFGKHFVNYIDDTTDMVATLIDLDDNSAIIYTLSTENSFHTILVTKFYRKKFTTSVSSKDLNQKILRFRDLIMQRDKYDIEQLAHELYNIVMSQLIEELKDSGVKTLLWMLEGSLRLLPVSALHDGTGYILKKYQNVYLTTKSRDNLQLQSKPRWTALGMGVTQAHENFKPLPAVKEELHGIVKSESSEDGILPGDILLDGDFTWDAMTNELDGEYQAVHIASHFKLDPCNETMSYLLLGDGSHLTLDKIKTEKALFRGVDLLTFSACSTGVGTTNKSGREIDGIGYIGETQGAKTVMATLWPVADESTSLLMKDFYRKRTEGASKIEALRQAQLGMLNGTTKPTKPQTERSGDDVVRYEVDKEKPYAHPYYWAPFVLIGNYR